MNSTGKPGPTSDADSDLELGRCLLLIVDLAIIGVIFVAPLLMGGRHPAGQFAFVSFVCVAAVAWTARQCFLKRAVFRRSGVELLLLAGVLLIGIQLLPLSPGWIARLSPAVGELLPLWPSQTAVPGHLDRWSQISLSPVATCAGLVMYVAYVMLFLVTVARIREVKDAERIIGWIGISAAFMALIGLLQYLSGNGKFLWVYQHPYRDTHDAVKGAFINQNHFAHFLALGVGPLLWWIQRLLRSQQKRHRRSFSLSGSDTDRKRLYVCAAVGALGLVTFAALLSFSRGGVLIILLATAVCTGIYVRASLLGRKALIGLVAVAALIGVGLCIHGYDSLAREVDTITDAETTHELSGGRGELWQSLAGAVPKFAIAGAGVGSHREVYPVFLTKYYRTEFTHAECGYLQVLLETGIPGLALLLTGIAVCGVWCVRSLFRSRSLSTTACIGAVSAGLLASVVHSLVDFVWYIPACMSISVVLIACACRLYQLVQAKRGARTREIPLPRTAWVAATGTVLVVSVLLVNNRFGPALASPHWDQYLALSLQSNQLDPSDPSWESTVGPRMAHLSETLTANPDDPRANVRMASLCLLYFEMAQRNAENVMPLVHVRNAALASKFESQQAQDQWLSRAIGENRKYLDLALYHARRGLKGCPLQGQGYLHLAELGFLEVTGDRTKDAYIAQAMKVRPHSGAVQFAVGREAALAGDFERARELWKQPFHHDPVIRLQIIESLGNVLRPDFFVEQFEPDLAGLGSLFSFYRRQERKEEARYVGHLYVRELAENSKDETASEAARQWHRAFAVHRYLNEGPEALQCIRRAVRLAPNEYVMRRGLATSLYGQQLYDEAVEHLQWCLHRNPDDTSLRKIIKIASRKRLDRISSRTGNVRERR